MSLAFTWGANPRRAAMQWLAKLSVAGLARVVVMFFTALRSRPLGLACTALVLSISTSLAAAPVLLALLLWLLASLVSLATWRALEPVLLRRLGCRLPGHLERERLDPLLASIRVEIHMVDAAEPWLFRGVRSVVVSRALLDLLEDPALAGLLAQAARQVGGASLAGELMVWLGNLPVLGAWWLSRGLVRLGRLLAVVVGISLVVPMVLWPDGFVRWAGRLFGTALVALLGSVLLSSGLAAIGLGLLLAWIVVPGLLRLVTWETQRAEAAADEATFEAGLGWELLEALETLTWAASVPPAPAPLGWLGRTASPLVDRADRIWRKLARL